MLAHCGDSTDLDYLEKLAASGALLGMDRFGLDVLLPFEERVKTVVAMCERGHADKMILSQDANCFSDWFPPGVRGAGLAELALPPRRPGRHPGAARARRRRRTTSTR